MKFYEFSFSKEENGDVVISQMDAYSEYPSSVVISKDQIEIFASLLVEYSKDGGNT